MVQTASRVPQTTEIMSALMRVGITHGDYNGVGYEVTLKALGDEEITELFTPVFYGIPTLVDKAVEMFHITLPEIHIIEDASEAEDGYLNIVDLRIADATVTPGEGTKASGTAAVAALERGVADVLEGKIDTLVTAPISKEAVQSDNFHFTGHTEFLGERTGCHPRMILFDGDLRVALLTTHTPISEVAGSVTRQAVIDAIKEFDSSLRLDFDIERPKIAVLALNPHAGDNGLLGTEEIREITPALAEVADRYLAFGPFPADGFFASGTYRKYDGAIAMYHDQGLAPFKALAGASGVNFTAGLPFVRTSPDHGTAYDIAWTGRADAESMRQAIYAAIDLSRNRRRNIAAAANPLPPTPEKPEKQEQKNHDKNHSEQAS